MSVRCYLFICIISFFVVASNALAAACPNGTTSSFANSNFCYSFQSGNKNFMAAEKYCNENFDGHLTSIHDMFGNMDISDQAAAAFANASTNSFWIGLNEKAGNWSWTDGSPSNFMDWKMPHTFTENGTTCTAMMIQGGDWVEANCTLEKPFVCLTTLEIPTTTVPNICEPGWTPFESRCYKAFDNATWSEAENQCEKNSAHLVDTESEGEDLFVADLAYYPGLNRCDPAAQAWVGKNSRQFSDDNSCTFLRIRACSQHDITGQIDLTDCNLTLAKFVCRKDKF